MVGEILVGLGWCVLSTLPEVFDITKRAAVKAGPCPLGEGEKGGRVMKLINLTPHEVNIVTEAGIISIPASGVVARAAATPTPVGTIEVDGAEIDLVSTAYGAVENLPEPEADTIFIVSALTISAAPDRTDLFSPADLVRDEAGNIIGCRAFTR